MINKYNTGMETYDPTKENTSLQADAASAKLAPDAIVPRAAILNVITGEERTITVGDLTDVLELFLVEDPEE